MSALNELAANQPSNEGLEENDVKSLKEIIQDAHLNNLGKSVFDVDAMAPLNKTSLVTIFPLYDARY